MIVPGTEKMTPADHIEEVNRLHADVMGQRLEKPIALTSWCHMFLDQAFRHADKETAAKIEQIRRRCERIK